MNFFICDIEDPAYRRNDLTKISTSELDKIKDADFLYLGDSIYYVEDADIYLASLYDHSNDPEFFIECNTIERLCLSYLNNNVASEGFRKLIFDQNYRRMLTAPEIRQFIERAGFFIHTETCYDANTCFTFKKERPY